MAAIAIAIAIASEAEVEVEVEVETETEAGSASGRGRGAAPQTAQAAGAPSVRGLHAADLLHLQLTHASGVVTPRAAHIGEHGGHFGVAQG